jgi:predicted TIM-barrel fold metal-dependent hydrolase
MASFESKERILFRKIRNEMAERLSVRYGMTRRQFFRTSCGLAVTFLALNQAYGTLFSVDPAEGKDMDAGQERMKSLSGQFIFDAQLHFVQETYPRREILGLREAAKAWNPDLRTEKTAIEHIQFENFVKEVFENSQTTVGLLSSAPADDPKNWFLTNDQLAGARKMVNERLKARRLLCHAVFTPGQPGWLEEVDRAIEALKPDAWKGYTIGDPLGISRFPWRLDDEKLVYPAYEKMERAGIRNVCIHKGLIPPGFRTSIPHLWRYATADDVGKAAKDWPGLRFIIYHSALQSASFPEGSSAEVLKTGRIPWVTELAEIPEKTGVTNVYGEIGTSFAASCLAEPKLCAAMLGTLIRGLGPDHVIWGTDSVWYGSPQWQIEAMRRIEIPEEMRKQYGFPSLGAPDSPLRNEIVGFNSARLYGLKPETP